MPSLPSTQRAVVLPAKRTPLVEISVPVYQPGPGEVVVHVQWTASTPLDLHRADGGLLISKYPYQTGSGGASGTVVAVGEGGDLKGITVGDRVAAFAFHGGKESNHQEYITIPAYLASRIPDDFSFEEAVTMPVNLVTVFHTATADLGLELPWPIPEGYSPQDAHEPLLIWGAASSVGIFAVQAFRHWGYKNIIAVASSKHHSYLRTLGATETFDYRHSDVIDQILAHAKVGSGAKVPYIIDCIGSIEGTLKPLTKIAHAGTKVAIMLPVILQDATEDEEPEYEMEVSKCLQDEWADGVILRGVRTHNYLNNEFYKEKLQSEIVPTLMREKIVSPNRYRVVEGSTAVERAQNALDILRRRDVSGERLIWRVSEAEI
ncbi:chaperonin 10-like protein [Mariannaea sp. PMI_226]|nr:chaperonin 10-like protein [Mariannaea sp. PMI_226]